MNPDRVRNILVVRNDRFGEFLLNIPAFRALKETFAKAGITAVINPYVRELAENIPFIDDIVEWGQGNHRAFDRIRLIGILRSRKFDLALMLNPSKEFNILTYSSGIPVRAGYARKLGFLLTHKIKDKKYLGQKHEVEYNLELARLIGASTTDKSLALSVDESAADSVFSEYGLNDAAGPLLLHLWTSDPLKEWPVNNFRELVKKILAQTHRKLVVIGGVDEAQKSEEFCREFDRSRVVDLSGKTSLKQLAALLKRSCLLISADSGPVHLASAVGLTSVVLFKDDLPGKSAKRWGPWDKHSVVIEKKSLSDINVEEVFCKIKEKLY